MRLLKVVRWAECAGSKQHIASCTALLPIILCKSGFPKYRAPPRATSLSRLLITLRVTNTSLELSRLVRRRNTPAVRYFAPCPANTHPQVLYIQRITVQIRIIKRFSRSFADWMLAGCLWKHLHILQIDVNFSIWYYNYLKVKIGLINSHALAGRILQIW